ncbi:MAG: molybdopterin-dependent oxidoreductase [Chthonomonadales bacterium]|nr:molybdopterin-dependent oxidoreductase [Chthonomonadales bacterium]
MGHRLTTCAFCGAGCGLYLETSRGRVVGAYPSVSHPTNRGRICLRGWHVHEVAGSPDRLDRPMIRRDRKPGDPPARTEDFSPVSWDEAVAFIAERLRAVRDRYGPDSLAFLNSPRCGNEESYLLQKLARAVIGTNNVDHGTGVYCNNSINVLLDMLGAPATTGSIGDLAVSDVIVVDGIDLGRQIPTVGGVVLRSKLNGAKLIVIDARRHRLAESADIFLHIRPGTETTLYGAMAKVLLDRGLVRRPFVRDRCSGFEELARSALLYDVARSAEECGVEADLIERAAVAFGEAGAAALLYSTGIEARSAETIRAAVNLALMAGHIGRPGAGIYALTEHNNLQGVCDMGMLPDRLPGYGPVEDPEARERCERLWDVRLPDRRGLKARQVLHRDGHDVHAIWLCRYDPARTAFEGDAEATLRQCDFVVAQHLFMTETAAYADVVLPTTAFGEEQVSFTSADRRIQLARKVTDGPGDTEPAWHQIVRVARALGADWNYAGSADVMAEIGRAVPEYAAASHENLTREYGRQWPCTHDRPLGTQTLFVENDDGTGVTANRNRRFAMKPFPPPSQSMRDPAYPLTLVFGNSSYYWHQNVLIQHSETLKREYRILLLDYPQGFVEVNTSDAADLGVRDGETIRLCSGVGCVEVAARVTPEVRSGAVFVPFFVRAVQEKIRGHVRNGGPYVAVRIERLAP